MEDASGTVATQLCTFLAAPRYLAEDEPLVDGVRMRLNDAALSDGDGDAESLESLGDVLSRTMEAGLVERSIVEELPPGPITFASPPCCPSTYLTEGGTRPTGGPVRRTHNSDELPVDCGG